MLATADLEVICVKWTRPIWFGKNYTLHQKWRNCTTGQSWPFLRENLVLCMNSTLLRRCQGLPEFLMELTPQTAHTHRQNVLAFTRDSINFAWRDVFLSHFLCGSCRTLQIKHALRLSNLCIKFDAEISAAVPGIASVSYIICLSITDLCRLCKATYP